MSLNHHGNSEQSELIKRFMAQSTGTAVREWPNGRMGGDDGGSLTYAMATNDQHRTIVIKFPKQVDWIALTVSDAEQLRDQLTERLMYLKGVRT